MTAPERPRPVWDRGEPIDPQMLAFTVGDDWRMDRRLVEHDLAGSLAHAAGLRRAGLLSEKDHEAIRAGLEELRASHRRGEWDVEETDEDVHSAVEWRLIERIGEPGKRLHTGRSRNEQVALDLRMWLRDAVAGVRDALSRSENAAKQLEARAGHLPLPGYTHLRRAMPSSVGDWIRAFARALADDREELLLSERRARLCPLGSGAGYGVPLALDRAFVAAELGFEGPDEPVTHVQWSRGRAELAYVTALESIALDLGKWAFDLWLFTTKEFGFAHLPVALTTGSSLMPHKRNPDLLELIRAHSRQVAVDRTSLLEVIRDLPSGYHRDFQLVKGPLFRAHDRIESMLPLAAKVLDGLELDEAALTAACADPQLRATEKLLDRAREGVPFRDAYREASRGE